MRSAREIQFRLRQEAANSLLALSSPKLTLRADTPLALLPEPSAVAQALRGTNYARELMAIADEILRGRIPIFDRVIDYGEEIAWRRDPHRSIETPTRYFRRIPYLDLAAAGDHKFVWEINRHQHLVLLAQAAALTGSDAYAEYIFRQIEQWWAENPFQRGINWTSALEVGFRALSWVWIFHVVGGRMSAAFLQRFLGELYRHGLHLEYNLSIYFSPNTHLLGEAVALHTLGRLFPQFPRAERWRTLGRDIVSEHMGACVRSDGSYFEQSTYYHMYAVDMFAFHAAVEPVPSQYLETLARMGEFLAAIVSQGGGLPFLGDDDGGRLFHPVGSRSHFARATLAVASLLSGKRFFPYNQKDLSEIALWWLGPERCGVPRADAFAINSRSYADAGIVVMRRGPVVALFDAGPFGPWGAGHSHSDTLSLVVTVGEQEVLIDAGTYSYMDPEWRPRFRGSAAHNTIRIDGHDQGIAAGPFRWAQKPEVKLLDWSGGTGEHATASCSYHGFTHRRTVEFAANEFCISDEINGPAGEHDIEQFWHFAQEPRELAPGRWDIGNIAEFTADGGVVEPAWRSRCFGSKESAWVIVVRRRTGLPTQLHARLRLFR
jgi:Heparinase II/III-like protein/Heparinase II/III N-terminus